jgi:hypothetical protein
MHALAQFSRPSRFPGQPNDLCPTNDTWLELMLGWGARNGIAKLAVGINRVGPGSDQGHLTAEHAEKLWQFMQAGGAQ